MFVCVQNKHFCNFDTYVDDTTKEVMVNKYMYIKITKSSAVQ